MTSNDISFFGNLKQRKAGIDMIQSVERKMKKKPETLDCTCGGEMTMYFTNKKYYYKVAETERVLDILNAPLYKCNSCGKVVEDLLLYADVEKAIEEEIFLKLNRRQKVSDTLDFNEFMK
ncbi:MULTISPECIES: hypothetical protein [Bacillati]|uniref:hypothetical protein n=1 Tax=Bacillati TaxID=1783272 RepID=UPI0022B9B479|nr:hypothetical protein [Caldifermentibacillus hisashii]